MSDDYKEVVCPECGYEQWVDIDDDVILCDECGCQYDVSEIENS